MTINSKRVIYFLSAFFILALDQWTKKMALVNLMDGSVYVFSWLDFILAYNKGAAFGLLDTGGHWQRIFFLTVAFIVSIVCIQWIWSQDHFTLNLASIFLLSGACGNAVDRVQFGYVIDFIGMHYEQWYFPIFNVADIAISLGAIFLFSYFQFFQDNLEK